MYDAHLQPYSFTKEGGNKLPEAREKPDRTLTWLMVATHVYLSCFQSRASSEDQDR